MKTYLFSFLLAMVASVVATAVVRRIAVRWNLVDRPTLQRKVHRIPIPRIGGIGILIGVLVPLTSFLVVEGVSPIAAVRAAPGNFPGLLVGGVLASLLGLLDDVRGMGALGFFIGAWFGFGVSIWLGLLLAVSGGFVLFEALRGWCVMRACGIKTRV